MQTSQEKITEALRWFVVVLVVVLAVKVWSVSRPSAAFWFDQWISLRTDSSKENVDRVAKRIGVQARNDREFEFYFKNFLLDEFAAKELELDDYVLLAQQQRDLAENRPNSGKYYLEFCRKRAELIRRGQVELNQLQIEIEDYGELIDLGFAANAADAAVSELTWVNGASLTYPQFAAFLQYLVFATDLETELLRGRDVSDVRLLAGRLNIDEMKLLKWPETLGNFAWQLQRNLYGIRVSRPLGAALYQKGFREGVTNLLGQLEQQGALKPFSIGVMIQNYDRSNRHFIFEGFIFEQKFYIVKTAPQLDDWNGALAQLDQLANADVNRVMSEAEFTEMQGAIQQLQAARRKFSAAGDALAQLIQDEDLADIAKPEKAAQVQLLLWFYLQQHSGQLQLPAQLEHCKFQNFYYTQTQEVTKPMQERLKKLNLPMNIELYITSDVKPLTPRQTITEMDEIVNYLQN